LGFDGGVGRRRLLLDLGLALGFRFLLRRGLGIEPVQDLLLDLVAMAKRRGLGPGIGGGALLGARGIFLAQLGLRRGRGGLLLLPALAHDPQRGLALLGLVVLPGKI